MSFLAESQRVSRSGILALLELRATPFAETLRIVDDNEDFVFNGVTYTRFPFGFTPPSDQKSSASQIKLVISNVGRSMTEDFESLGPNDRVHARIMLVDKKQPTVIAMEWRVPLSNVTVDMATATATCGNFQIMKQQASRLRYDQFLAPGLF